MNDLISHPRRCNSLGLVLMKQQWMMSFIPSRKSLSFIIISKLLLSLQCLVVLLIL